MRTSGQTGIRTHAVGQNSLVYWLSILSVTACCCLNGTLPQKIGDATLIHWCQHEIDVLSAFFRHFLPSPPFAACVGFVILAQLLEMRAVSSLFCVLWPSWLDWFCVDSEILGFYEKRPHNVLLLRSTGKYDRYRGQNIRTGQCIKRWTKCSRA